MNGYKGLGRQAPARVRTPLVLVQQLPPPPKRRRRGDDAVALWAGICLALGVALICAAITLAPLLPA